MSCKQKRLSELLSDISPELEDLVESGKIKIETLGRLKKDLLIKRRKKFFS